MTRAFVILIFLGLILTLFFGCDNDTDEDSDNSGDDDDQPGDDDDNDDNNDDDNNDDNDDDVFPPEEQTPFFEKGLILPPDSLECIPVETGVPQFNCNHHGSTVAQLPDGTVAAVWYHGEKEKSPDAAIVWSKLAPEALEWTWPEVLFDDPDRSEGNPAMWVNDEGEFFLFFVSIYGDSWPESKIRLITSADDGETWSAPVMLRDRYHWMTRHRPVRLANGELLLPLYSESLAYPVFMRSADEFTTWVEEPHFDLSFLLSHLGQIQPALSVTDTGRIIALTRDGLPTQRVKRMVSDDNGHTWTPSRSTSLPNSGTSIDQVRLLDGRTVVIYNDDPHARFPLTASLSMDDAATFVAKKNLNDECEGDSCSYAYPSVMQSTHDGTIWVTYSYGRSTIGWVHFNEAWLLDL